MARWIYAVTTNSKDAARENEFNDWYTNIHLPDVLETPGFVGARRYQIKEPAEGKAKFLALYEIEADDVDKALAALLENMARKRAEGRITELLEVADRGVYLQIAELSK